MSTQENWGEEDSSGNDDFAALQTENTAPQKQSRLISRVLTPALRLWLKSQLEQVEDLELEIEAGDRQLLSGTIRRVSVSATKAIYQGLHLSQAQVSGQMIQTNLGQVVRGKPFRLLQSFPVSGQVALTEADLNASLNAPLLGTAVTDFLLSLIRPNAQSGDRASDAASLEQIQVAFEADALRFKATLIHNHQPQAIEIYTQLSVEQGNILKLENFQCWLVTDKPAPSFPQQFTFPLGSEVQLDELAVQAGQIICRGTVTVMP